MVCVSITITVHMGIQLFFGCSFPSKNISNALLCSALLCFAWHHFILLNVYENRIHSCAWARSIGYRLRIILLILFVLRCWYLLVVEFLLLSPPPKLFHSNRHHIWKILYVFDYIFMVSRVFWTFVYWVVKCCNMPDNHQWHG